MPKMVNGEQSSVISAHFMNCLTPASSSENVKTQAGTYPNFPALQLLPFLPELWQKAVWSLAKYDVRFSLDHKILIMQLLARVTALSTQHPRLSYIRAEVAYYHHQLRAGNPRCARPVYPCAYTPGRTDTRDLQTRP